MRRAAPLLKVAGVGVGGYVHTELEATSVVVYSCTNPAGHSVPGQTDRVRVGSAAGDFQADRNGQVTGSINAALTYSGRVALSEYCVDAYQLRSAERAVVAVRLGLEQVRLVRTRDIDRLKPNAVIPDPRYLILDHWAVAPSGGGLHRRLKLGHVVPGIKKGKGRPTRSKP